MPEGMKAVGGVGNGVFEIVQDLTGYQNLCYISADDEELYSQLFQKAGQISRFIWTRFLDEFKDTRRHRSGCGLQRFPGGNERIHRGCYPDLQWTRRLRLRKRQLHT